MGEDEKELEKLKRDEAKQMKVRHQIFLWTLCPFTKSYVDTILQSDATLIHRVSLHECRVSV